ncbi:MAG TPA: phosphatidylserine/phosphatidylglycerophosphate/cardiolipin synthase family protein [Chthoniobacterales bacterium]|nr:phosphatidylserine/phosphatidylglycerophosphate/cardiolipin synthase family protein [Chthoniobacterales bacterium]
MESTIQRDESDDQLSVFFLAEGEQSGASVMGRLTHFLGQAQRSLDLAVYDMRLDDELRLQLLQALEERAAAGVQIRICYDGDKPETPNVAGGQDPAPPGTGAFVQGLGFPWRRIGGVKLMHDKFIVRDGAAVWTGSLNLTNDAFTLMENNVIELDSPVLAAFYAEDFEQIWEKGNFENTGHLKTTSATLRFAGEPVTVRVMFSPGCGLEIDAEVARRVRAAQQRVRLCSLLINSGTLISALDHLLGAGRVKVDGIFDRTQMEGVFRQWQTVPSNQWKIPAVRQIIARAHLVGKNSTPYTPTGRHDFMHNKVLIIDDTVITGSYNFSRSAQFNAENILFLESAALAQRYSVYIDHLLLKYGVTQPSL